MLTLKKIAIFTFTKTALFLVIFCLNTEANAACSYPADINGGYGITMNIPLRVTEGSTCAIRSSYPQFIGAINVTRKAAHGIAGKNADGGAYQPNPNFKGKDRFSYTVTSNSNWIGGAGKVTTINVDVTVD
jgi:hypothetical protein